MNPRDDELRDALRDLAGTVRTPDLYEGAVRRSRRIARREATVGTGAALVLGVLASGLWQLPAGHREEVPPVAAVRPSSTPAPPSPVPRVGTPAPAASRRATNLVPVPPHRTNRTRAVTTTVRPRSRALADLPGQIFYQQKDAHPDVVRLLPRQHGRIETVLRAAPSPVGISPDGARIAYVAGGRLLIGGTDAVSSGAPDQVADGVTTADQAPVWSPDGDQLLVDASVPAAVEVSSGSILPLAAGLETGRHFRWSGDGSKLIYATSSGRLEMAGTIDLAGADVPLVGEPHPVDTAGTGTSCEPISVDATGRRVAVPMAAAGAGTADAVVDTTTGDIVPLPVSGTVVGAAFDQEGDLLVRVHREGKMVLSLFSPDNTLLVQTPEPAATRDLEMIAYTR